VLFRSSSSITGKATLDATGNVANTINGQSAISGFARVDVAIQFVRTSDISAKATLSAASTIGSPINGSASIIGIASLTALPSGQLQSSITGIALLNATGTLANPIYETSNIVGIGNVTGTWQYVGNSNIRGIATLTSYAISPTTPAIPQFAAIIGIARLTANGSNPTLCECPPWIHADTTVCGWQTDDSAICSTQVTSSGLYPLPFTLPVFRVHILGEALTLTTVVTPLYNTDEPTCVDYNNVPTDVAVYQGTPSLVKSFKRSGCN
jgi:hypothetical protein